MKTKIVYTLISNKGDLYLEQLWLSVYSLRLHNKDVHVTVVMDDKTSETLVGYRAKVMDLIDEKIVITPPKDFDNRFRSRYIKIQLRQFVTGDYLFVDTDTIITGPLDEIDQYIDGGVETAMALDGHRKISPYHRPDRLRLKTLGLDKQVRNGENYYNTGVILMKDCEVNHEISKKWYQNWQYEITKGIHYDQVALFMTLENNNFKIVELPGEWNCQVTAACSQAIFKSKIIHYFNANTKKNAERRTIHYYFSSITPFKRIKECEVIPCDIIEKLNEAKYLFCITDDSSLQLTLKEKESSLHMFFLYNPSVWTFFENCATILYKTAKLLLIK